MVGVASNNPTFFNNAGVSWSMLAVVLHIGEDGGLFDTAGDIAFVIKLMSLVYITFWLYQTFAESQILFGLSAIGAGYFMLFHSTVFVAIAFMVLLMVMGNWLQTGIQFGLAPFLSAFGPTRKIGQALSMGGGGGMEDNEDIQRKIAAGEQLTAEDVALAQQQEQMEQQMMLQRNRQMSMRMR